MSSNIYETRVSSQVWFFVYFAGDKHLMIILTFFATQMASSDN